MIHTGLHDTSTHPHVSFEAFGDESAEKNVFRTAVHNGTVQSTTRLSESHHVDCVHHNISSSADRATHIIWYIHTSVYIVSPVASCTSEMYKTCRTSNSSCC